MLKSCKLPVCLIIPGSNGLEGTTQGVPLAMAMYTLTVTTGTLIHQLHSAYPIVSQVWYVDDVTDVGTCLSLKKW